MLRKIFMLMMVMALIFILSAGCATSFTNWWNTNETDLRTAVHGGTLIAIKRYPDLAMMMTKNIKAAQAAIAVGTLSNAGMVSDYLQKQLAFQNLTPAEQIVMEDLYSMVQDKIVSAFKAMNITTPADELVEVNKVLQWVLEITTLS